MVTLTDEQKIQRAARRQAIKAEREALWRQQLEDHKKREDAFRASAPAKIANLHTLAKSLGVRTEVTLTSTGPDVLFEYDGSEDNVYIDEILNYSSREAEVECVEEKLKEIQAARAARDKRKLLATAGWNKLSDEEKAAIKEFKWSFL